MRGKRLLALFLVLALCMAPLPAARAFDVSDLVIPDCAVPLVYGQSGAGRDLMAYRFGYGKNVLVLGFEIHGWEDGWARDGDALVYAAGQLMNELAAHLDLLRDYDWTVYVLPSMNPDGLIDGYSHNGPGRQTTTRLDSSGVLHTGQGIDLNRCFPAGWTPYSSARNYNGSSPMEAKEAKALSELLQQVKGGGLNVLIDVHGWTGQIITSSGRQGALYQCFHENFPGNTYVSLYGARGYFSWYAVTLGYAACLFEFPWGVGGLEGFQNGGYCGRFTRSVFSFIQRCGDYQEGRKTVTVQVDPSGSGRGAVSGGGYYGPDEPVIVTARAEEGSAFEGWYGADGTLCSTDLVYTFTPAENTALSARFAQTVRVTLASSRSGTASGGGTLVSGKAATLTAAPAETFQGWYRTDGTLLSTEACFDFLPERDEALIAMFAGDAFYDIEAGSWYLEDAMEAQRLGLIGGVNDVTFSAHSVLTRGMAVTILARLDEALRRLEPQEEPPESPEDTGAEEADTEDAEVPGSGETTQDGASQETAAEDVPALAPFGDVPEAAYYAVPVAWAYAKGVADGIDGEHFRPEQTVSREQFVTLLTRYLARCQGLSIDEAELPPFADEAEISPYALDAVRQARSIGLIDGYEDGRLRPRTGMTRASGVTMLVRLYHYLTDQMDTAEEGAVEASEE